MHKEEKVAKAEKKGKKEDACTGQRTTVDMEPAGDNHRGDQKANGNLLTDNEQEASEGSEASSTRCGDESEHGVDGDLEYHEPDRPVLFKGCMTGVRLIDSVDMRRSCFVPKNIRCDVGGRKLTGENDRKAQRNDGNGKGMAVLDSIGVPVMSEDDEVDDSDYDETLGVRGRGGNSMCKKSDESFSSEKCAESHSRLCRIPGVSCVFVDRRVRMAKHLINSKTVNLYPMANDNPTFNGIYFSEETRLKTNFKPYWAV